MGGKGEMLTLALVAGCTTGDVVWTRDPVAHVWWPAEVLDPLSLPKGRELPEGEGEDGACWADVCWECQGLVCSCVCMGGGKAVGCTACACVAVAVVVAAPDEGT